MSPQYLRAAEETPGAENRIPFSLLDQLPGAILLLDPEGRVTYLNGIAELHMDAVRSELVGRDFFRDVLPGLESEGWGERFRAGMATGRVSLAFETAPPRGVGIGRLSLGVRSFLHDGSLGAIVLVEDRSALALEEVRRKRAERLAAVGDLATGVAHEINNPLASIKGFAQLLSRDVTGPEHQQALEIISRECSRVAGIIDNLLDFADQQRSVKREALSFSEIVGGMLDLRQYALETSGIDVQRDLDPALSPVFGERGALQRAVLALLSHAEGSLHQRTGERHLVARTRESTDGVVFYLMDNGPGISRDRLPHLFTAVDPDETAGGVGLSGAHAIVREHGGHLWADSVEGEGTAFYIRLPRWVHQEAPEVVEVPQPKLRSLPDRALRVLVADDEPTLRLAIALFLGRHGHEVVQASDAYEALRLAQEQRFDAVLADARMPGDGLALLQKLEAMPELSGRTILMTGAHPQGPESQAGPPDRPRLNKPFDMTEVIRLVESIGR